MLSGFILTKIKMTEQITTIPEGSIEVQISNGTASVKILSTKETDTLDRVSGMALGLHLKLKEQRHLGYIG